MDRRNCLRHAKTVAPVVASVYIITDGRRTYSICTYMVLRQVWSDLGSSEHCCTVPSSPCTVHAFMLRTHMTGQRSREKGYCILYQEEVICEGSGFPLNMTQLSPGKIIKKLI